MTKADERAELERLMAQKVRRPELAIPRGEEERDQIPVTRIPTKPMDAALSASFKQVGIDKRAQAVKPKKASGKTTTNPVTKRKRQPKRNWEAQRRYDEIHGTSNGYDERIEQAILDRQYEAGDY